MSMYACKNMRMYVCMYICMFLCISVDILFIAKNHSDEDDERYTTSDFDVIDKYF